MDGSALMKPTRGLGRVLESVGLAALCRASSDVKLLCLGRFIRMTGYGVTTLVLPAYLAALGVPDDRIGLFMTLTLIGDISVSFLVTMVADRLGRRAVLAAGAALMSASGLIFGLCSNFWILLAAAVVGVISPSGHEVGVFRAVEESAIAWLTPATARSDLFAWYALLGNGGLAFGIFLCGWALHVVREVAGWSQLESCRFIFLAYCGLGGLKILLAACMSSNVEVHRKASTGSAEEAPLLQKEHKTETIASVQKDSNAKTPNTPTASSSWFPQLSRESWSIVSKLCALFAIDAFASAMASVTWLSYYFAEKFNMDAGQLGTVFSFATTLSAVSMIGASAIAKKIGNVKTMVFCHLPSAFLLALIPIPNALPLALTFLLLTACSHCADVAPRSAFIAGAVLPRERTAVLGLLSVVKTLASSLGPLLTGLLASHSRFGLAFVIAGGLKAVYDLSLLATFASAKPRDDEDLATQQAAVVAVVATEEAATTLPAIQATTTTREVDYVAIACDFDAKETATVVSTYEIVEDEVKASSSASSSASTIASASSSASTSPCPSRRPSE